MAAEVLARELRLDLFRIDLSAVGEQVHRRDGEEPAPGVRCGGGKGARSCCSTRRTRSSASAAEVKDSHDRYANIEVGYLLQRMEAYRGLAILTTNQKEALDEAFLRRIRFVVQFPFPDAALARAHLAAVFPEQTPVAELDHRRLARLNVTGGNIRNIALYAAFLAADAEAPAVEHGAPMIGRVGVVERRCRVGRDDSSSRGSVWICRRCGAPRHGGGDIGGVGEGAGLHRGFRCVLRVREWAPGTARGDRLLAHELTHTLQQRDRAPIGTLRRAIELKPPGRGEASAFDRAQELVDRSTPCR
jgi:SpoVK/Ycf46/Vps4 family AAA+-type ATPase